MNDQAALPRQSQHLVSMMSFVCPLFTRYLGGVKAFLGETGEKTRTAMKQACKLS
jgi:hypothetical protein